MILEVADILVKADTGAQFEAQVEQAKHLFMQTAGYIRHSLQRGIENPNRYVLLVYWETLEAHTVTFRESENFPKWRSYIGDFFAQAPHVEHFEICGE